MTRITARARVQITLDIPVEGVWAGDAPVEVVHKQARESAVDLLRSAVVIDGLRASSVGAHSPIVPATIVGTPKVTMIIVDEEQK